MCRCLTRLVKYVLPLVLVVCLAGCNDDDDGKLGDGHDFGDNDPNLHTAVGDSITASGWPGILEGMLGKPVINRGSGGSTTAEGIGQAASALSRDNPGYLLIQYGANDVIHNYNIDTSVNNLRAIVRQAKANQTIPVVATLTPMGGDHEVFDGQAGKLSNAIRDMADQEGAAVADVASSFGGDTTLLRDGLHPNDAGKQEIAATFYDTLN